MAAQRDILEPENDSHVQVKAEFQFQFLKR